MMMVAQREDPPSTSFLRYASSCGRNPPPISFCVCTLALDWQKTCNRASLLHPVSSSAFLNGLMRMLSIPSILHLGLLYSAAPSLKEPQLLLLTGLR